jgi:hypothetical protein
MVLPAQTVSVQPGAAVVVAAEQLCCKRYLSIRMVHLQHLAAEEELAFIQEAQAGAVCLASLSFNEDDCLRSEEASATRLPSKCSAFQAPNSYLFLSISQQSMNPRPVSWSS